MGTILFRTTNQKFPLRAKTLFGRDASCTVHVEDPKVSHEHASLRWKDGAWELRDLGSSNGTYIGSRRLAAGERVQLEIGTVFSLSGSSAVFELVDTSPPFAAALHRASGKVHIAAGGILVLPNEDQPRLTMFASSDGSWYIEIEKEVRLAKNGEELTLGGEVYVIEVPTTTIGTARSGGNTLILEALRLRFVVAPDEESVEVTMITGNKSVTLSPRRYHYLLLTLARAWIADAGISPRVRGFRDRDELCNQLGVDVMKLNTEVYRLRKQFVEMGVQGAAGLIERRPGTYEIRIGLTNLEVDVI